MELLKWLNTNYPALLAMAALGSNLATLAIGLFQHRLMWRDYRERKGINGYGRHHK